LISEIYAASEKPIPGVTGLALVEQIAAHGHHELYFCPTLEEMSDKLLSIVKPGDVVMTLGAGNIMQVGESLLRRLNQRGPTV
jgi:UDP-N-acetylmuramate--alanine ligase